MSTGRTTWWAKDANWGERELILELGEEFGADGPYLIDQLSSMAQAQRAGGQVFTGYRAIARRCFMTVERARDIVAAASRIGLLDDLSPHEDGRRFECRISGWKADQENAKAAQRMRDKRAREHAAEDGATDSDATEPAVTEPNSANEPSPTRPDQTRPEENTLVGSADAEPDGPVSSGTDPDETAQRRRQREEIQAVFEAWIRATRRSARTRLDDKRRRTIRRAIDEYGFDDVLAAVQGVALSQHHMSDPAYSEPKVVLRDAAQVEKFRDLHHRTRTVGSVASTSVVDRAAAFNRPTGDAA